MKFPAPALTFAALFFLFLTVLTMSAHFFKYRADPLEAKFFQEAWQKKEGSEVISILFTGDIMLDRYVNTLRQRNGGDFPFTYMPEIISTIESALDVDELDLVVGNLEGPITDSAYINNGTALIFNFKPDVVDLLKNAGFTTFSMANNHALDMGKSGPQQTHDYLTAAGIEAFGHPDIPNGEYSFITYDFSGTTLGFLGLNDAVIRLDTDAAIAKIKEVNPLVDYLIVGVHWGWEYETTARESVVAKAHAFVDNGADFIWGNHPHVVQNHEEYNGVPIYYSLGNFVFDQYFSDEVREGLVLGLKIQDGQLTVVEQMVDLVNGAEPKPRP
ncbi:MAG: CapA family protein [Candidatus Gracilibacteria bacterium]